MLDEIVEVLRAVRFRIAVGEQVERGQAFQRVHRLAKLGDGALIPLMVARKGNHRQVLANKEADLLCLLRVEPEFGGDTFRLFRTRFRMPRVWFIDVVQKECHVKRSCVGE